jgi:hypothetical protein
MHQESPAWILLYFASYLLTHLAVFVLWFRHRTWAASERAILLFHLIPAVLVVAAAVFLLVVKWNEASFAVFLSLVSAHGIYSLTFLELWTLAQISYSRDVLRNVRENGLDETAVADLVTLGERKRAARLGVLASSGLVRREQDRWTLTAKGRIAARLLSLVAWLPAIKAPG